MPLSPPPAAPYDSLAMVTQLTRTILGDYIQSVVAAPQGICNTNGTALTWVSGPQFSLYFNGVPIQIGAVAYTIARVTSATTAILTTSAGVQAGVVWVASIPTGDIFSDAQAYVLPTANLAWRKLQKKLADKGHPRLESEAEVIALPVIANLDQIGRASCRERV